jgi:predicted transcriptional regulator
MLDLDKDSAVYAFNCLTHEELRAKITARLIKQDIPFLTFASASGKTKIAIAVSLGKSKYIKRMEHSFTQEVVAEMLVKLGLTELAHTDYDSCHAGFWAFALTRQIGLEMTQTQFAHSLQQEPFDLAPIMYQIRQASSAKLSLKFDLSTLDSEMQAELAKLTERETTVLEYMLATASVDLENTGHITVSQQAVANAMECSISTVARALRSLVSKGLIKKTATGNIFTGCAQYTLSNDLWEAVLTSEEAAQKMEQKVIQVRRWNGLVPEPNKVVGSEEAMLTWLLENKPLIEGSRFSHYPAWYGGLSKVGYTTEMVIDTILIHNCGSRLSRSEVRSAINWLSRQDMRKAS